MIARAAEGSVRDGLSLLDQAIAYGEGKVKAADVAAMLGMIDRGRIIDLFEAVMTGDTARAIMLLEAQHRDGGDPVAALIDVADFVHWVTRLKVARDSALADPARTEVEKQRGAVIAARLGMAHLTRAWSMSLKGIKEAELHSDALMAVEMVLIRLAHAADLPGSEELARLVRQGGGTEKIVSLPASQLLKRDEPAAESNGALAVKAALMPQPEQSEPRAFSSFKDILALAAEKRDIKLKSDLERLVRPIRVSPGQFELALEPAAPPGLPGEIARKLEAWTGIRWMVLVAREGGDKPVTTQQKENRDGLFRMAREHQDVQAVFKRFPGAEVVDVREPEPQSMSEMDEEPR
jgi:DNA polymerase-3 subunit gamma/tau